ncbi:MAG: C25 family cysteine peptidase [Lysobacterales bacterium]
MDSVSGSVKNRSAGWALGVCRTLLWVLALSFASGAQAQAPVFTSPNNVTFSINGYMVFNVTATGAPTVSYSVSGTLPTGVSFNGTTGLLSGTPAANTAGTYPLVFTATNGVAPNATQNFTLTVNTPGPADDGDVTLTGSYALNSYSTITAAATSGTTTLTVASVAALALPACSGSCSNTNAVAGHGMGTTLTQGDLLMIYQPQELGGTITTTNSTAFGAVTDYGQAGIYEFVKVGSIAGNVITLQTPGTPNCTGLKNSYDSGAMVIRVPELRNLTISSGGVLTPASSWNGSTGGVIAVFVQPGAPYNAANGTLTINGTGLIDASGTGFRGGVVDNETTDAGTTVNDYTANLCTAGGRKGESILGYAGDVNTGTCGATASNNETGSYANGAFNRGALANGGGGGNAHNAGGGGGANGGAIGSWTGSGNPITGFDAAWNLDNNTSDANDLPTVTSATTGVTGGGRGGYTFAYNDQNAGLVAPGCSRLNPGCNGGQDWGGNARLNRGGLGGRPLARRPAGETFDRVYFGGGGGAGDGNNAAAQNGAAGGGLIYILAQQINTNNAAPTTVIQSNGANALGTVSGGNDAPGGGGGGGTVVALVSGAVSNNVRFAANGGTGGSQTIAGSESEGPGGGGGGGVVQVTRGSGSPTYQVNGGANGTSNSGAVAEFVHNGATQGGAGEVVWGPSRSDTPFLCVQSTGSNFTTPVSNAWFRSEVQGSNLQIDFAASAEVGNLGYQLYGVRNGQRVAVGGLIGSKAIDSVLPQNYSLSVPNAGYSELYLADLSITGKEVLRGPFTPGASFGSPPQSSTYDWTVSRNERVQLQQRRAAAGSDTAYVQVSERGMQRVSYEALQSAGVQLNGPAEQIAVIGRDGPVARRIRGGSQFGPGSVIEFYGDPTPDLYSRTETYLVRSEPDMVRDMPRQRPLSLPSGIEAIQTAKVLYAPQSNYSFSSPISDPWYAARIVANGGAASANFTLAATAPIGSQGKLKGQLWGGLDYPAGALPDHHVRVLLNGQLVAEGRFDGLIPWEFEADVASIVNGNNTVTIELPRDTGNPADLVYLESLQLSYTRTPAMTGTRYFDEGLRAASAVSDSLFADGLGDAQPAQPLQLATVSFSALGRTERSFRIDAGQPTELELSPDRAIAASDLGETSVLWLSDAQSLLQPAVSAAPARADLSVGTADYWVITHGQFAAQLQPLLQLRQREGLTPQLVDVEQIYLAYSAGNPDPMAIRRFVTEVAAPSGARYLLLVGGDTYDGPGYLGSGSISFVPTMYARTNEVVAFAPADEYYGDLTGDGLAEIAVGRLPVRTQAEATESVRKLLQYDNQPATQRVLLVAGARDTNQQLDFTQSATTLGNSMATGWQQTAVYSDVLGVSAARTALISALNDGQSLVSYTGHSSPTQWGFEQLLTATQVGGLASNANQPVVLQFGCWTTYFVSPQANTMGHALMLSANRGGSAVIGSTVLLDQPSHDAMARAMSGRLLPGTRIGSALVEAKRQIAAESTSQFSRNEIYLGIALLGDPAQMLR